MVSMNLTKILAVVVLGCSIATPTFAKAAKLDPPPQKMQYEKQTQSLGSIVKPQYPKKYTQDYIATIKDEYKPSSREEVIYVALDMLKGTNGDFSKRAILGNNLTMKPIKVEFKDLGSINKNYANFDALGWKRGSRLYIYINQKHSDAPAIALAALLSHEAIHQDEYNSLSEETYAWTMETAVWCELTELFPNQDDSLHPLVNRENTLKKLFEKGGYTNKYVKKTVYSNPGYQNLPETSPGFEEL